jgi:predicted nucleic acid-binding protein
MIVAIDTNVIAALWDRDESLNLSAHRALDTAASKGSLAVSGPVYAELLAAPGRDEAFLDEFFEATRIAIDWDLNEGVWREAGRAYHRYAMRRRRSEGAGPRRILADFLVGAHAQERRAALLTLDTSIFRSAFPNLELIRF